MRQDPLDAAKPWLQLCGSCDCGIHTAACTCPPGDYRPAMLLLYREVEKLREVVAAQFYANKPRQPAATKFHRTQEPE